MARPKRPYDDPMTDTATSSATTVPGAPSPFPTLPNWRDLGYWPAADGKIVRPGMLYRTTEFEKTSEADLKAVGDLGLATIVDLRTVPERGACPDPVFDDVGPLWLNILEDAPHTAGANPMKYATDPSAVKELTPTVAQEMMIGTYQQLINSDSALRYYGEFYTLLLAGDLTPTAFHCTTGKDRTGWTAASFLSLMGVAKDDVYKDYLLTNSRLLPALAPLVSQFEKQGVDAGALNSLLGVEKVYLDTAFDLVAKGWGTLENYFAEGLGIDVDGQAELRARYLVDPS